MWGSHAPPCSLLFRSSSRLDFCPAHTPHLHGPSLSFRIEGENPGEGEPAPLYACPRIPVEPQWQENLDLLLATSSLQTQGRAGRPFIGHLVAEHTGQLHMMSRGSLTFHCLRFPTWSFVQQNRIEPLLRAGSRRNRHCGLSGNQARRNPLPHGIRCPVGSAERDRKGHKWEN